MLNIGDKVRYTAPSVSCEGVELRTLVGELISIRSSFGEVRYEGLQRKTLWVPLSQLISETGKEVETTTVK